MKLLLKTLTAFLMGLLITGAMLFVPAGTLEYRGAWLFITLLFTPILIMGIVLLVKNPELLHKRLEMKEREKEQPKSTQFGFKSLRLARTLEPGFVFTIEPGIYFIPELIDKWRAEKQFADFICYDKLDAWKDFGGIRNEEDYLITPEGSRHLGKHKPCTTEEIEAECNR